MIEFSASKPSPDGTEAPPHRHRSRSVARGVIGNFRTKDNGSEKITLNITECNSLVNQSFVCLLPILFLKSGFSKMVILMPIILIHNGN